MRTDPEVIRAPVTDWLVENLRITGFVHGNPDIRNVRWIEDLIGGDVEFTHNESAGLAKTQVVKLGDGQLTLQRIPVPGIVHGSSGRSARRG
jgi:hypothetical protein